MIRVQRTVHALAVHSIHLKCRLEGRTCHSVLVSAPSLFFLAGCDLLRLVISIWPTDSPAIEGIFVRQSKPNTSLIEYHCLECNGYLDPSTFSLPRSAPGHPD